MFRGASKGPPASPEDQVGRLISRGARDGRGTPPAAAVVMEYNLYARLEWSPN